MDQPLQTVLVGSVEGRSVTCRTGDDVVNSRGLGHKKPGNAGHDDLRVLEGDGKGYGIESLEFR
jgi:uncharacterized protein YjlB